MYIYTRIMAETPKMAIEQGFKNKRIFLRFKDSLQNTNKLISIGNTKQVSNRTLELIDSAVREYNIPPEEKALMYKALYS